VFRAFHDFVAAYGFNFDVLASSNFGHQVAVRVNASPVATAQLDQAAS
jgi:hypothetical protein